MRVVVLQLVEEVVEVMLESLGVVFINAVCTILSLD